MLGRIGARIARGNNILTDVNEMETNVRLNPVSNCAPMVFACRSSHLRPSLTDLDEPVAST